MIEVTSEIITELKDWLNQKHQGTEIEVCKGRDNLIACMNIQNRYRIQFGVGGIEELYNIELSAASIAGHEILKMGFMGSNLTFHNIIAHVCLHETSHLVQMLNAKQKSEIGGFQYHDEYFYRILSRLHRSNIGTVAIKEVQKKLVDAGIEDRFSCGTPAYPESRRIKCLHMKRGDSVRFFADNHERRGSLVSKNDLLARVESDSKIFSIGIFGVNLD